MEIFNPFYKSRSRNRDRWLLIGIGGGGDIYGCLPLKWNLEQIGFEVHLGSLTWERDVVDPKSVPRRVTDLEHVELIGEYGAIGNANTCLEKFCFQGALLSSRLKGEKVFFVDINGGPSGVRVAINAYCTRFDITGVVGLDVGGDVIATGQEPGLESPLADATMLSGIAQIDPKYRAIIGIFGMNADGELTQPELLLRFSTIAREGYLGAIGHGPAAFALLKEVLNDDKHVTEASRQPLRALAGEIGQTRIRNGHRRVDINLLLTITFLFDARKIFPLCPIAYEIRDAESITEVDRRIRTKFGIGTEYNP
ncbi:MAG: hypothetical protein RBG13Loki_3650 [Promethearchaeota archaeon CR_4]|nr:MAG: hypothetical protein RBG13Loki_3650 [Candidatus Lokiarchaeota archaeon CR_4]